MARRNAKKQPEAHKIDCAEVFIRRKAFFFIPNNFIIFYHSAGLNPAECNICQSKYPYRQV